MRLEFRIGDLAAFVATSGYVFTAHAHKRRSVYLGGSGKKILASAFDSLTPISL